MKSSNLIKALDGDKFHAFQIHCENLQTKWIYFDFVRLDFHQIRTASLICFTMNYSSK